jgi:hypothetical protein
MNTPPSSSRAYRRLGYLALAHAAILIALTAWLIQSQGSNQPWVVRIWVGLVTLWFLWVVVLALHRGRSIWRFVIFALLSVILIWPSFRFYNTFAPEAFGLPWAVSMDPVSVWKYFSAYRAGRTDAQKDVAAGILAIEEFGFGAGGGPHTQRILRERFQIEIRATAGCIVDEKILGHAAGYNSVSEPEIDRRFGRNRVEAAREEASKLAKEEYAREEQSFKELTTRLTSLPPDGKVITESISSYLDQKPLNDPAAEEELAPLVHAVETFVVEHVPKDAPPFTLHVSVYATPTSDPRFEISAHDPPRPVYENIYNNLQTITVPRWTKGSLTLSMDFVIR